MYYSNHSKEYVMCGMETLAFDIIICWKWFGMKKNKYLDFNGTLK